MNLDIFCKIIDNYGDFGVAFRFTKEYRTYYPESTIRFFIDDLSVAYKLNPLILPNERIQTVNGLLIVQSTTISDELLSKHEMPELVITSLGCDLPDSYFKAATKYSKLIINLEHLLLEDWAKEYHLKESLLNIEKKYFLKKYFFMPGITLGTGGILIEQTLKEKQLNWQKNRVELLNNFLKPFDLNFNGIYDKNIFGTLFSYQHDFTALLKTIAAQDKHFYLFVMGEKTIESITFLAKQENIPQIANKHYQKGNLHLLIMPLINQADYDCLLNIADFNMVRGEDSFVRALLAGKPFLWHIYNQEDNYHLVNLKAFLQIMKPFFSINGMEDTACFNHYEELITTYCTRKEDSFLLEARENFDFFFENIHKLSYYTAQFQQYLFNNCNLMQNLLLFIKQTMSH